MLKVYLYINIKLLESEGAGRMSLDIGLRWASPDYYHKRA